MVQLISESTPQILSPAPQSGGKKVVKKSSKAKTEKKPASKKVKKTADKKAKKPASKKIKGGDGADGNDGESDSGDDDAKDVKDAKDVNNNPILNEFIQEQAKNAHFSDKTNIRTDENFYANLEESYMTQMLSNEDFRKKTAIVLRTLVMQHIHKEILEKKETKDLELTLAEGGATKKPNPKPKVSKPKVSKPKVSKPKVSKAK